MHCAYALIKALSDVHKSVKLNLSIGTLSNQQKVKSVRTRSWIIQQKLCKWGDGA